MNEQIINFLKENIQLVILLSTLGPILIGSLFYFFSFFKKKTYVCTECGSTIMTEDSKVNFCSVCGTKDSYKKQ